MARSILLITLAFVLGWGDVFAEDIIQTVPLRISVEPPTAESSFMEFRMKSASLSSVWAFQLDVLLTGGLDFDDDAGSPFSLPYECYPLQTNGITPEHHIDYAHLPSGWWRIIVTPDNQMRISGTDELVLKARYKATGSWSPGIYPVYVKRSVLSLDGREGAEPLSSVSYVTIGPSPLSTTETPSLTMMEGYVPSFVVDSLNQDLSVNPDLSCLDIRNIDSLSCPLSIQNSNGLMLAKAGTSHAQYTNTIAIGDGDSAICRVLQLDQAAGPFSSPIEFYPREVSLSRPLSSARWNTICLPFKMTSEQVNEVLGSKTLLARFTGMVDTLGGNYLRFTMIDNAEGIQANVPYIVQPGHDISVWSLGQTQVLPTTSLEQSVDDFVFVGSYRTVNPVPDGYYYIYNNLFWLSQGLSKMLAFRGYFRDDRPAPSRKGNLSFFLDDDKVETSVNGIRSLHSTSGPIYNLQGQRINRPQRGIYVVGGRKMVRIRK